MGKKISHFEKALTLELFWLKAELIRMYSHDTNRCAKCGKRESLQLHHIRHDGEADRNQWDMKSNTPHIMGYYYRMYFDFLQNPVEACKRIGVLCAECNRNDG